MTTPNLQQLSRLLTRLSLLVNGKEGSFARKRDCIKALKALKSEAEQGRYDCWHTVPKLLEVLQDQLGTEEAAKLITGDVQSISEVNATWRLSRATIRKQQLPLLTFVMKYSRFLPIAIQRQTTTLSDAEYTRNTKIHEANSIVQNIESILTRTDEVLYLYYLIRVYDTEKGKHALSMLIKNMKNHGAGVRSELEALQRSLNLPSRLLVRSDYVEVINGIYNTAEESNYMHDKTVDELMQLQRWIEAQLIPQLERHHDTLLQQASIVADMQNAWKHDYVERDIIDDVKRMSTLLNQEDELRERIREDLEYYMRKNTRMKKIMRFTKRADQELMSHHADLYGVVVLCYQLFPLLSAFYQADEFNHYWDVAEDFLLPPSGIKKVISSIGLRAFLGLL
ncbi:MAG: hypothetical protein ACE5DM_05455 [Candidatus Nanoarchaeia archaeon]